MIAATRFAAPLPEGGTIGVAALASPYDMRSGLERGVERCASRGARRAERERRGPRAWTSASAPVFSRCSSR